MGQCLKNKEVEVGADGQPLSGDGGAENGARGAKDKMADSEGGVLTVTPVAGEPVEAEYLTALFGGPTPRRGADIVLADPPQACEELKNAEAAQGKFVLVRRGGCMFADKSKVRAVRVRWYCAVVLCCVSLCVRCLQGAGGDDRFTMRGEGGSSIGGLRLVCMCHRYQPASL